MQVPRWLSAALRIDEQLLLVARERPRHERRAQLDRQRAGVDRRQLVRRCPPFSRRADVGGRRELPLGQPVAAVVLDDVDDRHVAAHQVHELADADRAGVAVAADADRDQLAVGEHRAGADRRHPAVHGVEAVRRAEEVRRALARAADARQLDDALADRSPISKNASMMRSEIALWPQPAHSVVLPPRYGCISRPMRLIFLPGSGVAVVVMVVGRLSAPDSSPPAAGATRAPPSRGVRCAFMPFLRSGSRRSPTARRSAARCSGARSAASRCAPARSSSRIRPSICASRFCSTT